MSKIKLVIFDLDDTLFDCSGQLVDEARKRAAKVLSEKIPQASAVEILEKERQLHKKFGPTFEVFDKICMDFKVEGKEACINSALHAYNSDEVGEISLFPETAPLLKKLEEMGIKKVLVTSGLHARQQRKIEILGLDKLMDLALIHDLEKSPVSRERLFKNVLEKFSVKPDEVLSVGDRIQREIRIGNKLGMITARMLHGRFKKLKPKNDFEDPDFEISKLSEVLGVIDSVKQGKGRKPKVVAIGGGTGLPMVLSGLKEHTKNLTAIVTVTDSGRSSGMLRKDLNILPPGDLRNCLVALSDSEQLLLDLFGYRFKNGGLEGHSFGNLFIAVLAKTTGSFEKAIKEASRILAIKGKVLPSTLQDTHICAELEDGKIVEQEFNVREPGKSPIKRVFLKNEVKPLDEALEAIKEADLIVLGPGSLFTSILPNLLVKGMSKAIGESKAKKVYIPNIMTQPGQTDNFSLSMHVSQIEKYLGAGSLDLVLLNSKKPSEALLKKYVKEKAFLVERDLEKLPKNVKVVEDDLLEKESEQVLWQKQYLLRHDPKKLGKALFKLA
jgi:uncharacterized cofD-like protein